jgi:hypothetical protein
MPWRKPNFILIIHIVVFGIEALGLEQADFLGDQCVASIDEHKDGDVRRLPPTPYRKIPVQTGPAEPA